jgi:hypothetical protein
MLREGLGMREEKTIADFCVWKEEFCNELCLYLLAPDVLQGYLGWYGKP